MKLGFWAVFVGLGLVSCGGSADSGNGTGGGSGTGASGGTSGTGATGGTSGTGATGGGGTGGTAGSPSGCPAQQPNGGACTTPNLRCTYGDDVRPECRSDWICNGGTWVTTKGMCLQPPPGACGATPPPPDTICANEGDVCSWPDGTLCGCSSCSGGPCSPPPPKWRCTPPPVTPGCPAIVPNDGSACGAGEGTTCTYGDPCGLSGTNVLCTKGAWLWQSPGACPL